MSGPWVELPRADWAELARESRIEVDTATIQRLRGLKDPTDEQDVAEVYLPLAQLITMRRVNHQRLHQATNDFLRISPSCTPFIIGIAGSVAVGKSTTARLLQELLRRSPGHPRVDLVTTDGFLLPNAELDRRGLTTRKGFPESYDRRGLLDFVIAVKSGLPRVQAPVYSHVIYDIVPDRFISIERPEILILEGLNVLQPASTDAGDDNLTVSDFFDFSVYVDADAEVIRSWFLARFLALRDSAFKDPTSFFQAFAELSDDEAIAQANAVWDSINRPNLVENIEPSRGRATVILRKGADHLVESVRMRKI